MSNNQRRGSISYVASVSVGFLWVFHFLTARKAGRERKKHFFLLFFSLVAISARSNSEKRPFWGREAGGFLGTVLRKVVGSPLSILIIIVD